jgi:hypothetical protein
VEQETCLTLCRFVVEKKVVNAARWLFPPAGAERPFPQGVSSMILIGLPANWSFAAGCL